MWTFSPSNAALVIFKLQWETFFKTTSLFRRPGRAAKWRGLVPPGHGCHTTALVMLLAYPALLPVGESPGWHNVMAMASSQITCHTWFNSHCPQALGLRVTHADFLLLEDSRLLPEPEEEQDAVPSTQMSRALHSRGGGGFPLQTRRAMGVTF